MIPPALRMVTTLIMMAIAGLAQQAAAGPTFDVVSLKRASCDDQHGREGGPGTSDPIRYSFRAGTLEELIALAYHVDSFQISSKVPLDKQCFNLSAGIEPGATRDEFRMMLRNLLATRFHLKAHLEPHEYPGYDLVVAKSGSKLKESGVGRAAKAAESPDGFPELPDSEPALISWFSKGSGYRLARMRAQQQSMSSFVAQLQAPGVPFIFDRTGLSGKYDFTFEYATEFASGSEAGPPPVADLFTALRQQLGLELVKTTVTRDLVVVESVDKLPIEN